MANITTQTIRVDLSTGKVIPTAYTHQNDTARTLVFDMYNNGLPYTMTGNTVKFAYKSPIVNGQYTVIAGASMASGTVSGNTVSVTLPAAYTAISGVGLLTMIITPTSGTIRPVNIKFIVQKSADGDDSIAGASDFPATLDEIAENWLDENISIQIDDTLSVSGKAADAKVTGDEISDLKSDINTVEGLISKDADTPNCNNSETEVAAWSILAYPMISGKTYKIRVRLNNWTEANLGRVNSIALYERQAASSLVTTLDFGELTSDSWMETMYTVPDGVSVTNIKMSVKGSYVADDDSVDYYIIETISAISEIVNISESVNEIGGVTYVEKNISNIINNAQPADTDQYAPKVGQTIISVMGSRLIYGGSWTSQATSKTMILRIPTEVKKIKFTANENGSVVAFLKSNDTTIGASVEFATGWTDKESILSGETKEYAIPSDAVFIYIELLSRGVDVTPQVNFVYSVYTDDLEEKDIPINAYDAVVYNYVTARQITYSNANNRATVWNTGASPSKTLLMPLDGAKKIKITANENNAASFAFLTTEAITVGQPPQYADGYAHPMNVPSANSVTLDVPSNAKLLYLRLIEADSTDRTPSSVKAYVPRERHSGKKPLFCFVDDDAKLDALNWLEQVVDATRIPMNIALITGVVGDNTFSTWDNLRRLKNKGFVFVNHTNTTVNLTTLTNEEIINSFETSQRLMQEHGMIHGDILVLPGGGTNDTITDIIKNYFTAAASTLKRLNLPPIDTFYFTRIDLDTYVNSEQAYVDKLDEWKEWVDKAISINALCIFYGHAYHADYTDERKLSDYIELVRYIAQKGGEIVSLPEALKRYGNIIEGDVIIGCDASISN